LCRTCTARTNYNRLNAYSKIRVCYCKITARATAATERSATARATADHEHVSKSRRCDR